MKNIFKYLGVMLCAVLGLTACSPDSFSGADPNGIPSLDGVEPVIMVDQNINQVTFSLPSDLKGCMPIWIFYENRGTEKEKITYSTVNGMQKIFANAGDYEGEFKLMNRNGISNGSKSFRFHIDNTIVDYGKYFTMLCGGKSDSSKEWRIDNSKQGHLGCGEPGTDGLNWWSAAPDDKKDWNVYDSRMTFSTMAGEATKGGYYFNPGESKQIYVNKDVAAFGGAQGQTDDFCVDAPEQNTEFEFVTEGDDLYIVFPEHTYFPYIANDDIWNEPRYRVESITPAEIQLVIDNGGIAWHYILTSGAAPQAFKGFDVNSPDNLWKQANATFQSLHYAHGTGWEGLPDYTHVEGDNSYTVSLPEATDMQWQAQYCLGTALNTSIVQPGKKYDFSCKVTSNNDLPSFTLKLTSPNDDPSLVNNQNSPMPIKAYEETIVYFTLCEAPSFDGNYKFVFDFGGNPAGTEITIKDIVVIDHDKNQIPAPEDDPDEPDPEKKMDWDVNAPSNLWKAVDEGSAFISITPWMTAPGWGGGLEPTYSNENGEYTVTLPEGLGGDQWMAQFPINTTLKASASKKYNFYCVLEADADAPGVTIKLTETDEDGAKHDDNFFFADRHDVKAFTPFIYKAEGVSLAKADAHALSLFFDFGGTPSGTTIKISKIYFEEVVSMDYNDADNLWKAVDEGSAFISITPWMTAPGWGGGLNPEWDHSGNEYTLTLPEGLGGDQWMAQFPINTTLKASANDSYNFSCTVETDADAPGVTIKLTETDEDGAKHDDNFFFADRHDVKAYTPFVYTAKNVKLGKNDAHALSLFFDFGGTPSGTNIKISNIVFKKN